jgi:hypothetical protein
VLHCLPPARLAAPSGIKAQAGPEENVTWLGIAPELRPAPDAPTNQPKPWQPQNHGNPETMASKNHGNPSKHHHHPANTATTQQIGHRPKGMPWHHANQLPSIPGSTTMAAVLNKESRLTQPSTIAAKPPPQRPTNPKTASSLVSAVRGASNPYHGKKAPRAGSVIFSKRNPMQHC